jgi:hypothetical protein
MIYFSLFTFQIRIAAIALLFSGIYIKSTGWNMVVFDGLFDNFLSAHYCVAGDFFSSLPLLSSLPPVKPNQEGKRRKLTKAEQLEFSLSAEKKDILVGLLLGDGFSQKPKGCVNTIFRFEQGLVHKDYLVHLYEIFKDYCSILPTIRNLKPQKGTGKIYSSIYFYTYLLPCFNPLYELFYPNGKKIVPLNIAELLTPLGLCYWIADDGSWDKNKKFVVLCTDSFTLLEVELLIESLNSKWNLKCYKCKQGNGYRIIIPSYSVPILQELLAQNMPTMMKYKIGL